MKHRIWRGLRLDASDRELVGRAVIITAGSVWAAGTIGLAWRVFALMGGLGG